MSPIRSPKKLRLDNMPGVWQSSRGFVKLAVEGNIAAGKSTFLKLMSEEGNLKMCPEPVLDWTAIKLDKEVNPNSENNLLAKFYEDPKRWALTFQNYALFSRVRNQPKLDFEDEGVYLCERSVYSDRLVFGRNGLKTNIMTPMEYSLYCKWHSFLTDNNEETDVDGFIYLRCSPEVCMKRLGMRGREEEDSVPLEYLNQINDRHEEWFIKRVDLPANVGRKPMLVVDCSGDLINNAELRRATLKKVLDFAETLNKPGLSGS